MKERKKFRWLFLPVLMGALWCLNDRCQPLRLREMQLENFSPQLEKELRNWSDTFLAFHPAWLLARSDLKRFEYEYPLTIKTSWSPLHGTLRLTAVPFNAALELSWKHTQYFAGENGTVWRGDLWRKSMKVETPSLPVLAVNDGYPLLDEDALSASAKLKVPFAWLWGLRQTLSSMDGTMKVQEAELLRRGGEDLIGCIFGNDADGSRIVFIGRVSLLEKSLLVVRELMRSQSGKNLFVDATYGDKVIVKKDVSPLKTSLNR